MPAQMAPADQLNRWVTILKALKSICANRFNGRVSMMTLNTFTKAAVVGTVGASRAVNFGSAVASDSTIRESIPDSLETRDNTTFESLTDVLAPNPLGLIVVTVVQANCDKSCIQADGTLNEGKTLAEAFPEGSDGWIKLQVIVTDSNLDQVIGDPAKVRGDLAKIIAAPAASILHDLVVYLSKIQ